MWGLPIDPDDPSKGGSGYFWLSYYDQSISLPAVYYFDYSLFGADTDTGFDPKNVVRNQHDFIPINIITAIPSEGEARMADGTYAYALTADSGKESANVKEGIFPRYSIGVIGQGESYVYRDGSWTDLATEDGLIALTGDAAMLKELKDSDIQLDNFNIKVYGLVK